MTMTATAVSQHTVGMCPQSSKRSQTVGRVLFPGDSSFPARIQFRVSISQPSFTALIRALFPSRKHESLMPSADKRTGFNLCAEEVTPLSHYLACEHEISSCFFPTRRVKSNVLLIQSSFKFPSNFSFHFPQLETLFPNSFWQCQNEASPKRTLLRILHQFLSLYRLFALHSQNTTHCFLSASGVFSFAATLDISIVHISEVSCHC